MLQPNWGNLLQTVEDDVLIAQSMAEAIDAGRIVPSMLGTNVTIEDIPGGKIIPVTRGRPISSEDLKSWGRNVQTAILSMWILMVDQALEDKHSTNRLQDTNQERGGVRCVIYQMRCAVAHTSYAPRWAVSSGFQRAFTVSGLKSGPLTLDFFQLNGQPFKPSQFGGWHRIIELLRFEL